MRVLVTGSRDWTDRYTIFNALDRYCPKDAVLVHGHCPTGADAIADEWAMANGVQVHRFPAEWDRYGSRAGFIRNSIMVEEGADLCFAFIKDESRGASMTARLAKSAGIRLMRYTREHRHDWQPPSGYRPENTSFRQCVCGAHGFQVEE